MNLPVCTKIKKMQKNKIHIWHFSDTHGFADLLKVPKDLDIMIFSGDCSNVRDPYNNEPEVRAFIDWYKRQNATYKIFVAGNHDTSIEKNLVKPKDFTDNGIIYLENDFIIIEDLKIWGSPFSPTFGDWSFMRSRDKMDKLWKHIPEDTDILVTHSPAKSVLDLSYNRDGKLEFCGCSSLMKHVERVKPKLHLYGHIHCVKNIRNAGTMKVANLDTIFSNGSVVTDNKFGKLTSQGNTFEI